MSVSLHRAIDQYNILHHPTRKIAEFFRVHPNVYKIALLVNHLFRAVAMHALVVLMPFSRLGNTAFCFASSLFYRLTVETKCAYKFSLPAFSGSLAFLIGKRGLRDLYNRSAFVSIGALSVAALSLIPLAAYCTYISLTIHYDVSH